MPRPLPAALTRRLALHVLGQLVASRFVDVPRSPAKLTPPATRFESSTAGEPIYFPPFWLDPINERLWRGDELLPIKPKAFALLRYLAERPQRLLTKDVLLDALWHGTHVSDDVIKTHLKDIRQALGDTAKTPRFIETVHRRGYRFIAAVSAHPSRAEVSAESDPLPFVGRSAELTRLEGVLSRALSGSRRLVFVAGEPGIGKTMLVNRLLNPLRRSQRAWVASGQCVSTYGIGEAYLPILDALGRLCREPGGERVVEILRRHAPAWLAQMPELLDRATLAALQQMLSGTGPERMLRELAMALPVLTSIRPLVLVLEDLHWADHSTLVLLGYLARRAEDAALLVLGTYRPQELGSRDHPLRAVQADLRLQVQYEELRVAALDREDVARYLAHRFIGHAFPRELADEIHSRTEGNPLFMVRLIDSLQDQQMLGRAEDGWRLCAELHAVARQLPSTVLTMIECQVEKLNDFERAVLEAASVVGFEFSASAVAYAIERDAASVEELCADWAARGQFLDNKGVCSGRNDSVSLRFDFNHALCQQAIYERLRPARLIQLHQRIGEYEEAWHGEGAGAVASALALHFEQGQRYSRAIRYRQLAGQHALQRNSYPEAIRHFTAGLSTLEQLEDSLERRRNELELRVGLGIPLTMTEGYGSPNVEQIYARATTLCRELGETTQLAPALAGVAQFYLVRGAYPVARELAEQLLGTPGQSAISRSHGHFIAGTAHFFQAQLTLAAPHFERGLALSEGGAEPFAHAVFYPQDPAVAAGCVFSWQAWQRGDSPRALWMAEEALRRAKALGQPFGTAFALQFILLLRQFRREPELALEHAQALIALSHEQGFAFFLALGIMGKGVAELHRGDYVSAVETIGRGWDAYRVTGAEIGATYYLSALGDALGKLGRFEQAFGVFADVRERLQRTGDRWWEPEVYRLHAELCATAAHDVTPLPVPVRLTAPVKDAAEAWLLEALRVAGDSKASALELRAATSLGRHWAALGLHAEAGRLMRDVCLRLPSGVDAAERDDALGLLQQLHQE